MTTKLFDRRSTGWKEPSSSAMLLYAAATARQRPTPRYSLGHKLPNGRLVVQRSCSNSQGWLYRLTPPKAATTNYAKAMASRFVTERDLTDLIEALQPTWRIEYRLHPADEEKALLDGEGKPLCINQREQAKSMAEAVFNFHEARREFSRVTYSQIGASAPCERFVSLKRPYRFRIGQRVNARIGQVQAYEIERRYITQDRTQYFGLRVLNGLRWLCEADLLPLNMNEHDTQEVFMI